MPAKAKATTKTAKTTDPDASLWEVAQQWMKNRRYGGSNELVSALRGWAQAKGLVQEDTEPVVVQTAEEAP